MATIQTVFGSRAFLTQLQTKQAAPTLLLKPESHGLDYMLLDSTGRGQFTLPFKYTFWPLVASSRRKIMST